MSEDNPRAMDDESDWMISALVCLADELKEDGRIVGSRNVMNIAKEIESLRGWLAKSQRRERVLAADVDVSIEIAKDCRRERDEAREALAEARSFIEWEAGEWWHDSGVDWPDWQDELERRGMLVEVPSDDAHKAEYGEDAETMLALKWSKTAQESAMRDAARAEGE